MAHARQQIRAAVAALLMRSPVTWKAAYTTRMPSSRAVMPYLLVFDDSEPVESISPNGPGVYLRDMAIVVAGRLRLPGNSDTESVEDAMDNLAVAVETALTFATLQADVDLLHGLRLASTEKVVVISEDAAPQYAEVTLNYVARYATQEGLPETLI